jgi:hypothetical protein
VVVEAVPLEVVQPHQLTLTPGVQAAVVPVRSTFPVSHPELWVLVDKVIQALVVIVVTPTLTLKLVVAGVALVLLVTLVYTAVVMVVPDPQIQSLVPR